jgi:hypothetical protein
MPLRIRADLHLRQPDHLTCTLTNTTDRNLAIRQFQPDFDLILLTADGVEAEPCITSSFGKLTTRLTLAPAQILAREIDLLDYYAFPVPGVYRIAANYDARRKTFKYDDLHDLDAVVAFSDTLSFTIAADQVRVPFKPDPAAAAAAQAYLDRLANKRWWQFWIQ